MVEKNGEGMPKPNPVDINPDINPVSPDEQASLRRKVGAIAGVAVAVPTLIAGAWFMDRADGAETVPARTDVKSEAERYSGPTFDTLLNANQRFAKTTPVVLANFGLRKILNEDYYNGGPYSIERVVVSAQHCTLNGQNINARRVPRLVFRNSGDPITPYKVTKLTPDAVTKGYELREKHLELMGKNGANQQPPVPYNYNSQTDFVGVLKAQICGNPNAVPVNGNVSMQSVKVGPRAFLEIIT